MEENELIQLLAGIRTEPIYVCRIKFEHASLIGATKTAVWLSRDTVEKQEHKHRDPDFNLYLLAPTIVAEGFIRVMPPYKLAFIHHIKDEGKTRSFRAVVKTTTDGHELYLVSVHRQRKSDVRATYAKSLSIEEWKARREVGPPTNPT